MVPRKIHVCWPTKDLLDIQAPMVQAGVRRLRDLNPDWHLTVYDDSDVMRELSSYMGSEKYEALFTDSGFVEKSDLWRLYKMYYEGGLYVDVDRLCDVRLSDILDEGVMCILPTCGDLDFSQDVMLSSPGNPIHARAISLIEHRRAEGSRNVYFLGPQTYMHAVTIELMGEMMDTNPGLEKFETIRAKIATIPFMRTYREDPPGHTLLYRGRDVTYGEWESMKRSFYAKSGLKHWSGEW